MLPQVINIKDRAEAEVSGLFDPHIVADVNGSQVKVAKFGPAFDWHAHEREDEAFMVLSGRIAIDFRDGTRELGEGDFLCVPRGVEHRPRALTDAPIVLLFEDASTLNTGDADSDLTVRNPKRLGG